ncbi:META domain containing protein, putative [Leishmania tarentolae]|uniref:META domain containing protein, putative n=1 Tax=Leishmania tarentolae TaxID=5689 RepID=A0A640KEB5_LEITA|nr:META domain containing protein, putative [Leishmania tarentolae]
MEVKNLLGVYKVTYVNGKPSPAGVTVEFKAGEDSGTVHIHAKVANVMDGRLTLQNRKLTGALVTTKMRGSDEHMSIENALSQGFTEGVAYTVEDGGQVTLQSKEVTIKLLPA